MRRMIRLAVCVMMAAASVPALAEKQAAPALRDGDQEVRDLHTSTTQPLAAMDDVDVGAGSGEPFSGADLRARDDARADEAAVREYNHRRFLEQTWMAAP